MRKRVFTTQIGVPVSKEFRDAVEMVCNEKEIAMAEYVRQAVEMRLEEDKQDLSGIVTDKED